jgi:hypothetical protein
MPRTRHKTSATRKRNYTTAKARLDPLAVGMPALDSITGVEEFKKGKNVLRTIHTDEVDAYERELAQPKRKNL